MMGWLPALVLVLAAPPRPAPVDPAVAEAEKEARAAEAALDQAILQALTAELQASASGQPRPVESPTAPQAAEPPAAPAAVTGRNPARPARPAHTEATAEPADDLAPVEPDLLTLGIFPNSSGFMDARLHFRKRYLEYFSSGVYFDYLTFRVATESGDDDGATARSDTVDRQYRLEADVLKGILPLHRWIFGGGTTRLTLEPGMGGKGILDKVDSSGFRKNGLGESVFLNEDKDILQLGVVADLELSLAAGSWFGLDASFEYLPYIYSKETAEKLNSQFPDEPIDAEIVNGTTGMQATVDLWATTARAGRFAVRARVYHNSGRVNTQATVVTGNFETEVRTSTDYAEDTAWLEFTHTMTYLRPWTLISPAVAVAVQRRDITTNDRDTRSDTFKIGLLAEIY